ncbi:MAG TPA: hypothetical protein VNI83_06965 [Vicinamibacterales bacterium]|nr:hypothetical protein [Vicinamibacterales bacterium]
MQTRSLAALAAAFALLASTAAAQVGAGTLVLRSGERLKFDVLDLGAVGFTLQADGQERRVPTADAAVIEFGGPEPPLGDIALSALRQGQHVIVLRSGETLTGHLVDIGEANPNRLYFDTPGGRRSWLATEVSRVYLTLPPGQAAATAGTTSAQPAEPGTIIVRGDQQWTPTGLVVRRGQRLRFQSSGEVRLNREGTEVAAVTGARTERRAPNAPAPDLIVGALIARIGDGPAFAIGDQTEVVMPASGPLFLGINDDHVADNTGEFRVVIRPAGRR